MLSYFYKGGFNYRWKNKSDQEPYSVYNYP